MDNSHDSEAMFLNFGVSDGDHEGQTEAGSNGVETATQHTARMLGKLFHDWARAVTGSGNPSDTRPAQENEERVTAICRKEAEVLVRHWANTILDIQAIEKCGQHASDYRRRKSRASVRIDKLIDAGLLSEAEVEAIFESEKKR